MSGVARVVLIDAAVWAGWSATVGYAVHLVPRRCYERDTWLTRIRSWERDGRVYESVRIRRWKDRVPEAGAFFTRGQSKRSLHDVSRAGLERFAVETRRAEYVHVSIAAITPLFALWNPWWLTLAMVAYGVTANVPFMAIQRYNRARILRLPIFAPPPAPADAARPDAVR